MIMVTLCQQHVFIYFATIIYIFPYIHQRSDEVQALFTVFSFILHQELSTYIPSIVFYLKRK